MGIRTDRSRRAPVEREPSWSSTDSIEVVDEFDEASLINDPKPSPNGLALGESKTESSKSAPAARYDFTEQHPLVPPVESLEGLRSSSFSVGPKPSFGDKLCCILQSLATFAGFFSLMQSFRSLEVDVFQTTGFKGQLQSVMAIGQFLMTLLTFAVGRRIHPVKTASRGMVVMISTSLWFILLFLVGSNNTFWFFGTFVVGFFLSSFVGLCTAAQFGAAASIHPDLVPSVAFGLSIAAISIFAFMWTARTAFESYTAPVVLVFSITATLQSTALILFNRLTTKPWVMLNLERARRENIAALQAKKHRGQESGVLEVHGSRLDILKRSAGPVSSCFLVMMGLFTVYPTILLSLLPSDRNSDTLILGCQDVGEFLGRLMPLYAIFLPRWILVPMSFARFLLIPLVRWMLLVEENTGIHSAAFVYCLQLLQGFNFGWILSTCMHEAGQKQLTRADKEQAAVFATVATNFGLSFGSLQQNLLLLANYFPGVRQ